MPGFRASRTSSSKVPSAASSSQPSYSICLMRSSNSRRASSSSRPASPCCFSLYKMLRGARGTLLQAVDNPQRVGGEHGLRMPERFDEIENGLGVGKRHGERYQGSRVVLLPCLLCPRIFVSSR